MRRVWVAAAVLAVGCASAPLNKQALAELARADALVLHGCYDCLLDARGIYEGMAVGKARALVVDHLFETNLLLTLREKELALDSSASLARARALAGELLPAVDAARYLVLVEAVPGDGSGWPRRETEAFRRDHVAFVPRINDELTWLETAALRQPVRQYVALAIDCSYPTRPKTPGGAPPVRLAVPPPRADPAAVSATASWPRGVAPDAPALVWYRRALCTDVPPTPLEQLRAVDSRFVETSLFLGRRAAALENTKGAPSSNVPKDGARKAKELIDEVYARFPTSPAVTYLQGNVAQLKGDCRSALRFYDETVAQKPLHEDALLGRTMCLAYLKQMDEAIQSATHMIELQTDNVAQAFYWRAWIRHFQKDFDLARADIEQAKARDRTAEIYTLAGIIEHDQNDLGIARDDLQNARLIRRQNCTAMWYLGLVAIKQERWLDSAGQFNDAMHCYETSVKEDEDGLTAVQTQKDLDPEYRARQIAGFEAALKDDRSQQYAAAFNAASRYSQSGDAAKARELIEIAARDPALATLVEALRKIIGGTSELRNPEPRNRPVSVTISSCLLMPISRRHSAISPWNSSTTRRRKPSPISWASPKAPRSGNIRRPANATPSRSMTGSSFTASSIAS